MYWFFLIFFIFISLSLVVLILLQPAKGLDTIHLNTKNNVNFLKNIRTNSFITNIIGIFSCLFLIISIILCNINNRTTNLDFFWENNKKNTITEKSLLNKKELKSDIPR